LRIGNFAIADAKQGPERELSLWPATDRAKLSGNLGLTDFGVTELSVESRAGSAASWKTEGISLRDRLPARPCCWWRSMSTQASITRWRDFANRIEGVGATTVQTNR
jgi:hypothetical protein